MSKFVTSRKSDSVNYCVLLWRTFPPNFIPIRFETTGLFLFWRGRSNKNNSENSKMSSDVRSVPDLKCSVTSAAGCIHTFCSWSCCRLKCFHGVTCSVVESIVWTARETAAWVSSRLGWVTVLGIASWTSTISIAIWWLLDASESARDLTKWLECCRRRRSVSSDVRVPVSNSRYVTSSSAAAAVYAYFCFFFFCFCCCSKDRKRRRRRTRSKHLLLFDVCHLNTTVTTTSHGDGWLQWQMTSQSHQHFLSLNATKSLALFNPPMWRCNQSINLEHCIIQTPPQNTRRFDKLLFSSHLLFNYHFYRLVLFNFLFFYKPPVAFCKW